MISINGLKLIYLPSIIEEYKQCNHALSNQNLLDLLLDLSKFILTLLFLGLLPCSQWQNLDCYCFYRLVKEYSMSRMLSFNEL